MHPSIKELAVKFPVPDRLLRILTDSVRFRNIHLQALRMRSRLKKMKVCEKSIPNAVRKLGIKSRAITLMHLITGKQCGLMKSKRILNSIKDEGRPGGAKKLQFVSDEKIFTGMLETVVPNHLGAREGVGRARAQARLALDRVVLARRHRHRRRAKRASGMREKSANTEPRF